VIRDKIATIETLKKLRSRTTESDEELDECLLAMNDFDISSQTSLLIFLLDSLHSLKYGNFRKIQ